MAFQLADALLRAGLFALLLVVAFLLMPWFLTAEHYADGDAVNAQFPVVLGDADAARILRWSAYQQAPAADRAPLFDEGRIDALVTVDGQRLTATARGGRVEVDLLDDDHRHWASYQIDQGQVHPRSYRRSGPYLLLYALIAALLLTPLLRGLCIAIWVRIHRTRVPRSTGARLD
ncbi:MAG: hypothetical protein KDI56_02410 [Xanthomonadales bacterium]|nr:hypothetical protein [Xanthomonadales bacterium]MCB1628959.1 hypothetical protein [Xanthomonadales bacterium]